MSGFLLTLGLVTLLGPDNAHDAAGLLEARCVRCHGGASTKGGLSLVDREGMTTGGESGPAITPGKPDESLLIEQISGAKPKMPRGGKALTSAEITTLRRWIEQGAPWPDGLVLKGPRSEANPWWALRPLKKPAIPEVADHERALSPIDAFLLEKLAAAGLTSQNAADRRTLIRRLTYDLIGLPPKPEEIQTFLNDPAPDAYERLVDRLLASPRYGERWGRHWLDIVHYGDTHGYDKDKRRPNAWPYRDEVIRSLNEDKPYARFVAEQIAGDVLYPGDARATIATGFIAAGPWDFVGHVELREGTVEKAKTRLLDRDDMLANTMSTFASLTVHCARCHDHKFDPIPQADYYRLQAVFAGVERGDRPYPDTDSARKKAAAEAAVTDANARLTELERQIAAPSSPELERLDADLDRRRAALAAMPKPAQSTASTTNGYHSAIETKPDVMKWVQVDLGRITPIDEIRLIPARPVDFPDTPGFGFPARFRIILADEPTFAQPRILVDRTAADVPNPRENWWIDRTSRTRTRCLRIEATRLWPRRNDYVFALGELQVLSDGINVAHAANVTALDSIEAGRWGKSFLVDGRDSRAVIDDPKDAATIAGRCDLFFQIQEGEAHRFELAEAIIPPDLRSQRDRLRSELRKAETRLAELPPPPQVYALHSHPPRPIHILKRGEVEQPGESVGPGAPACVPNLEPRFPNSDNEGARRAALAQWLIQRENVLVWRSIVNRVWQFHFGRGLVDTPNDFGHNGATPSHPELLDWLAVTFRDDLGGSLKRLHRLIVTSAAYRQSSAQLNNAALIDNDNRMLWRQDRRRLEAEAVRDAILSASGALDNRMGGPGFALFRFKDDHSPIYDHDDPAWINAPEGKRRAIYRFIVRSVPNPFLDCLDGADPNANVPIRNTTITALQALALLNDPFMIAQAETFANRLSAAGATTEDQMIEAFLLTLGRPPRAEEQAALIAYARRNGMASVCRLIFNLNEFVFID